MKKQLKTPADSWEFVNAKIDEFAKCWLEFEYSYPDSTASVYKQATKQIAEKLELN